MIPFIKIKTIGSFLLVMAVVIPASVFWGSCLGKAVLAGGVYVFAKPFCDVVEHMKPEEILKP